MNMCKKVNDKIARHYGNSRSVVNLIKSWPNIVISMVMPNIQELSFKPLKSSSIRIAVFSKYSLLSFNKKMKTVVKTLIKRDHYFIHEAIFYLKNSGF